MDRTLCTTFALITTSLIAFSVPNADAAQKAKAYDKPYAIPSEAKTAGALAAAPGIFIGTVTNCGVAGHPIVTAAWLRGIGLPDNGSSSNVGVNSGAHKGLYLGKNGPTSDCSASAAVIKNWPAGAPIFQLGFDFLNGTHCGNGAPRFNLYTSQGSYAAGCQGSGQLQGPAPQDPAEWTRMTLGPDCAGIVQLSAAVPFVCNSTPVQSIEIVYDEGTDTANPPNEPAGVGHVILDNILINNQYIRAGSGIRPTP